MKCRKKISILAITALVILLAGCSGYLKPDKKNLVVFENSIIKVQKPLNERSVESFAKKINTICDSYLADSDRIFYSVIPDKSFFISDKLEAPFDYNKMTSILETDIKNAQYIDIFDCLTLDDYFKTDIHWRQDHLQNVVNRLGESLGFKFELSCFVHNSFPNYLGFYAKHENAAAEELFYLTNKMTEDATVSNMQTPEVKTVYDTKKLETDIAYDVYLSGASPLITITNPNVTDDKELIIFRDSFTSSLAPLLIGEYKTITLIDLRYIQTALLPENVDFHGQDVLFLYNTEIINNSAMLK